jgi:hypothetical protein
VDGNSAGKLSVNGVSVNGKRISTLELRSGDTVMFGGHVTATYQVMAMDQAEFMKYLDMINYQSIKSLPVNAFETMVGDEEEAGPATSFFPSPDKKEPAALEKIERQPLWQQNWFKYVAVGVIGMVIGLGIGGGVLVAAGQLDPLNPTPRQPAAASPAPKSATQPRK